MDMSGLRKAYTAARYGTYRWYVGVYCDHLDKTVANVSRSDKALIFKLFKKLRDEHTINWSRNQLYEFNARHTSEVRRHTLSAIRHTDRFDVLKAALYLLRHLRRDCVVDNYLVGRLPWLRGYIEGYEEPDRTQLQKAVDGMSKAEHSLRDLEVLFITNRASPQIMAQREERVRPPRYHTIAVNSVELILTEECNLKCYNCDKMCGKAPSTDHMSVEQVRKFIEESKECGRQWERIAISGGECTLHPDIMEIVGLVLGYRNECLPKSSFVQVVSSGYGGAVPVLRRIAETYSQDVMPSTPSNTFIRNNEKRNRVVLHSPVNMAPIDDPRFKGSNFRRGCWVPEMCGIGLSRHGYYCCGTASAIDRVFGYDLGVKSLKEASMKRLVEQRRAFCGLCGRYDDLSISPEEYSSTWVVEEMASPTWEGAFRAYERRKPVLTLY